MPMGDAFVRTLNRNLPRFAEEKRPGLGSRRNSLVSEYAFRLYGEYVRGISAASLGFGSWPADAERRELAEEVRQYISSLERNPDIPDMDSAELAEAQEWASRLAVFAFKKHPRESVIVSPLFCGCGVVDDCFGDLLVGRTLYELKNVERDFRLTDVRQVLCYAALNSVSHQYQIDSVGLINARAGVYYRTDVTAIALAVSGVSAAALFSEITNYISADRASL